MRDLSRSQLDIFTSLIITVTVIILDRFSKNFFNEILEYGQSIPVIRGIFHFTLVHNTGIAFGLFKDKGAVFIIIPVIAIILLIYNIFFYKQYGEEAISRSYIVGFSLILGGAIGNVYDRIMFGHVIDFIDWRIWPVFNIADSAITIGAIIIAFKCFRLSAK